ncbi:hypothetical protein M408DRAFT_329159 [Serendipita vermifera MAFF 305830]|uniref:Translin n=1 Tax=Serendipita vermifera MAFF 305830 TaxID=933852 RepID=A0A0C2XHY2_SERVB|nr:hypothetical protein M408DRAFT_329159 [Serendipita vermifera MAFF 305830]
MVIESREDIVRVFDVFRAGIDERNDRRERIIKLSREITIQSKRVIFLIHRTVTDDNQSTISPDETPYQKAAKTAHGKLLHIKKSFILPLKAELISEADYWENQRSVTPGIQEFIEAVSYYHYFETDRLITHHEMEGWLTDESGNPILPLPYSEFLLGLSDLTGELMRFAITAIARGGGRAKSESVSEFVRRCNSDFERFTPFVRDLWKKQQVTRQSVLKIEQANYTVRLRSAEFQSDPQDIDRLVQRTMLQQEPPYHRRDLDTEGDDYMNT